MDELTLKQEIIAVSEKATLLQITNETELELSKKERLVLKGIMEQIGLFCNPGIEQAHKLHKELLSKKNQLLKMPEKADETIKEKQAVYLKEVARKRQDKKRI